MLIFCSQIIYTYLVLYYIHENQLHVSRNPDYYYVCMRVKQIVYKNKIVVEEFLIGLVLNASTKAGIFSFAIWKNHLSIVGWLVDWFSFLSFFFLRPLENTRIGANESEQIQT